MVDAGARWSPVARAESYATHGRKVFRRPTALAGTAAHDCLQAVLTRIIDTKSTKSKTVEHAMSFPYARTVPALGNAREPQRVSAVSAIRHTFIGADNGPQRPTRQRPAPRAACRSAPHDRIRPLRAISWPIKLRSPTNRYFSNNRFEPPFDNAFNVAGHRDTDRRRHPLPNAAHAATPENPHLSETSQRLLPTDWLSSARVSISTVPPGKPLVALIDGALRTWLPATASGFARRNGEDFRERKQARHPRAAPLPNSLTIKFASEIQRPAQRLANAAAATSLHRGSD
jgi:hypothetical protein